MMYSSVAVLALVASASAHGKIAALVGDAGGNTTALGIQGGIVPGAGSNDQTEVDTTVFGTGGGKGTRINVDGLGHTEGGGENKVSDLAQAMALSGSTLPQVSSSGGSISGVLHIVTTDGAGPFKAMVDSGATGAFASGTEAEVTTQVPGIGGNIRPDGTVPGQNKARGWALQARNLLHKRARNVNKDFPIAVSIPAGTTCTGTAAGQSNVCLLKIANNNPNGPFGGVIAFQMANKAAAATGAASATGAAAGSASTGAAAAGSSSCSDSTA